MLVRWQDHDFEIIVALACRDTGKNRVQCTDAGARYGDTGARHGEAWRSLERASADA